MEIDRFRNVLGIQPHPDDMDLALGGTIRRLARQGASVAYVTVTDGSLGTRDPGLSGEALAALRRDEQAAAAAVLGVRDLRYLAYPDGGPIDIRSLRDDLIAVIRDLRPDLVLLPDPWLPYEAHPDHLSVGMAGAQAALFAHLPGFARGRGARPFDVAHVGFYWCLVPSEVIDVGADWDRKLEAVSCHRSQFTEAAARAFLARQDDLRGRPVERLRLMDRDRLHVSPWASAHPDRPGAPPSVPSF